MSVKKYCDLETLQYYDSKWLLRFEAMEINNNDIDNLLLDNMGIVPTLPTSWTESANGTLDLSSSNAYSYWPEGAGTKTVSIANGTTSGLSKFFLKLTDAGNFPMQWGSNIQWKNGSEPVWQAFHEDIILFKSNDNGSTWIAQVVQTNEITPYWKFTVQMPAHHYWNDVQIANYDLAILLSQFENGATIDWGDGTIETVYTRTISDPYEDDPSEYGNRFPYHRYQEEGIYHVKVTYDDFTTVYAYNSLSADYLDDGHYFESYSSKIVASTINAVISIDSPLPRLGGSWVDYSSSWRRDDHSFELIFSDYEMLVSVPEKLFCNNTNNITYIYGAFQRTSIEDIILYIYNPNISSSLGPNGQFISYSSSYTGNNQNPTRIIYTPYDSTTYHNFIGIAQSNKLTIIGI